MENKKMFCACCENEGLILEMRCDICDVCGWQNSAYQESDPNIAGSPNKMSLNQAIKAFKNGEKVL